MEQTFDQYHKAWILISLDKSIWNMNTTTLFVDNKNVKYAGTNFILKPIFLQAWSSLGPTVCSAKRFNLISTPSHQYTMTPTLPPYYHTMNITQHYQHTVIIIPLYHHTITIPWHQHTTLPPYYHTMSITQHYIITSHHHQVAIKIINKEKLSESVLQKVDQRKEFINCFNEYCCHPYSYLFPAYVCNFCQIMSDFIGLF